MIIKYNDYYKTPGVRKYCNDIKKNPTRKDYNEAIAHMAQFFIGQGVLDKDSIIIPVPQHDGRAGYTLDIAHRCARIADATVMDILKCSPRMTMTEARNRGIIQDPGMYLNIKPNFIPDGKVFLLDNVITTGMTIKDANEALGGNAIPLVYAVDTVKCNMSEFFNYLTEIGHEARMVV